MTIVNSTNYMSVAYETANGLSALVGNRTLSKSELLNQLSPLFTKIREIAKVIPNSAKMIHSLGLIPQFSEPLTAKQTDQTLSLIAGHLLKISENDQASSEFDSNLTSDSEASTISYLQL